MKNLEAFDWLVIIVLAALLLSRVPALLRKWKSGSEKKDVLNDKDH